MDERRSKLDIPVGRVLYSSKVRDELRQGVCEWERKEMYQKDLEKVELKGFVNYPYLEAKKKAQFVIRSRFLT